MKELDMNCRRSIPPVLALALAVAFAAAPARAQDPALARPAPDAGKDPARNEVYVFGGISIVNAGTSTQTTIDLPAIPGFPGWPGNGSQGIQVGTETKLGNSALLGLRYAFYLRKQLALEVDAAVAPSHDLQGSVDLCGSSVCYGRGDYAGAGMGRSFDTAMDSLFGGRTGSQFRGMEGMRAGEGRFGGRYGYGGQSVTAWHYGAGLTYDLLGGDVRPFVIVGAGGVTYDGARSAKTDFVLRFGAGLKAYFGRVGARVDAVDYLVFDNFLTGQDEHDVHFTGGAFVRF
jgi:hypothetical protein